jgi:hypothetical protein
VNTSSASPTATQNESDAHDTELKFPLEVIGCGLDHVPSEKVYSEPPPPLPPPPTAMQNEDDGHETALGWSKGLSSICCPLDHVAWPLPPVSLDPTLAMLR